MRSHDVRVYLYDIRAGAEAIEGFTRGKTLGDFLGDLLLRSRSSGRATGRRDGKRLSKLCRSTMRKLPGERWRPRNRVTWNRGRSRSMRKQAPKRPQKLT